MAASPHTGNYSCREIGHSETADFGRPGMDQECLTFH